MSTMNTKGKLVQGAGGKNSPALQVDSLPAELPIYIPHPQNK